MLIVSAVLITGSGSSPYGRTAEIYNPLTKTSCSLPQLPEMRYQHTQDGELACGGPITIMEGVLSNSTCIKWSPVSGTWTKSHTLIRKRHGHVSWATTSGVYLIGSHYSARTSEKVKVDGSVEGTFGLKYHTRYNLHFIANSEFIFDSFACSIPDQDKEELIITGGSDTRTTVSVYNEAGWQRDLASLNQGRYYHACTSYVNGGKKVSHFMYV